MRHKILAGMVPAVMAAVGAAGYFTFRMSIIEDNPMWKKQRPEPDPDTPKGKRYYEKKQAEKNAEELPYEDAWITSRDGLKLHARFYPNDAAKRIVIFCHGYHGTSYGDFAFIFPILKDDCTILAIDERSMGESEGKYITFGAKEKEDIFDWAAWMDAHNEKRLPVYLFGVSMGAASVLMNADKEPAGVKGIIADCGYTTMDKIISDVQKAWYKASVKPVRMSLDLWCRMIAHFRMKDADALSAMKQAKLPVLFFHGTDDHFVAPYHTEMNAAACISAHHEVYVEGASHGASAQIDPELYERSLREFFEQYDH